MGSSGLHLRVLLLYVLIVVTLTQNAVYYLLDDFTDGGNLILVSFPIKECSRTGNLYSGVNSGVYHEYRCLNGELVFEYEYTNAECTGSGTTIETFVTSDFSKTNSGWGNCSADTASATINYMQFTTWAGKSPTADGCPWDNSTWTEKYDYTFATGVCVNQSGGTGYENDGYYMMASCDDTGGSWDLYTDSDCTIWDSQYRDIPFDCQWYFQKSGDANQYYHRFTHCFIDGSDVVMPSPAPTNDPSPLPTQGPTDEPTERPTDGPTAEPSTGRPTVDPTAFPSFEPTFEPTFDPSEFPTPEPTLRPTDSPTKMPVIKFDDDGGSNVPGSQQFLSSIDNLTFIEIVIIILFVFYVFICLYIWCNERRKRKSLTGNFQHGQDREARVAYLRQKNAERANNLNLEQGIPHAPSPRANPQAPMINKRQHLMREGM